MTDEDDDYQCACGQTFDSEAALAGHIESCPEADQSPSNSDATTQNEQETTMSDTHDADKERKMKQEIETILPDKDTFSNLSVTRTGYAEYQVLSTRNSGITLHTVRLNEPSCTCEDWQYNRQSGEREICAHYAAAFLEAGDIQVEDLGLATITSILTEVREARDELEHVIEMANGAAVEARETQANAAQQRVDESQNVDPSEAADRLQEAYDDVIDDMQVRATDNYVWVQTGQDTPDELPGPGSTSVFEALLQNAEQVHYVPDDYSGDLDRAKEEKPGEWWKNAIRPEDVEQYIMEVLE